MKKTAAALGLFVSVISSSGFAAEGTSPATGISHLDHVFLIVMENHGYSQIINNPNAPFINQYAHAANLATNYFGVGHPSLTNYLEIVGGSNFGVQNDNDVDWHNVSCSTNLTTGIAATDNPTTGKICPISGLGTDAATPAVDKTNETQDPKGFNNIDGLASFLAAPNTVGKTIADQLAARKLTWKSYQESLPLSGADKVNYSDGVYTDSTDFSTILPALTPPLSQGDVVKLYAAKHNPFAYFKSVQEGQDPNNSLKNVVDFDGASGLFADLGAGAAPNFSLIAPNQCNDQHARGNAGKFCNFDPSDNGTQAGLNPALIYRGDVAVQRIVTAIHQSLSWKAGRNAIVVVWDENDYSLAPNTNQVVAIIETNYGGPIGGVSSGTRYTHFSLLKSIEAGFGLPCLNHACDANVAVMSDLFGGNLLAPPPPIR